MSGEISRRLDEIKGQLNEDKLAEEGFKFFRGITPIRSGNARKRTRLNQDTIVADYPYAQRLDAGSSRQAPQGMTRPWQVWLNRQLKRIFGR
jgi:hypothetical protein